jgi:mono/diheme cytochrome c family protein
MRADDGLLPAAVVSELAQPAGRVLLMASVCLLVLGALLATAASASSNAKGAEGAALFKDKGCQHCHGADIAGTDRGPDLRTVGKRMHKNEIEQQIRDGGKEMPAFGDMLSKDEMKTLVDYLAHQKKLPKDAATAP